MSIVNYSRISHEDMDAMFGILLIVSFRFENQLLENRVASCDNAVYGITVRTRNGVKFEIRLMGTYFRI